RRCPTCQQDGRLLRTVEAMNDEARYTVAVRMLVRGDDRERLPDRQIDRNLEPLWTGFVMAVYAGRNPCGAIAIQYATRSSIRPSASGIDASSGIASRACPVTRVCTSGRPPSLATTSTQESASYGLDWISTSRTAGPGSAAASGLTNNSTRSLAHL